LANEIRVIYFHHLVVARLKGKGGEWSERKVSRTE
jgi:hypothetical protein